MTMIEAKRYILSIGPKGFDLHHHDFGSGNISSISSNSTTHTNLGRAITTALADSGQTFIEISVHDHRD